MRPAVRVKDVMTTKLVVVGPQASLDEAVGLMLDHRVSGLPVVDDSGALRGIVTEQDCLRVAFAERYHQTPERKVESAMTQKVMTIDAGQDIMIAIDLFLRHSFRRLPVLDSGKLVGLISRRDALRALRQPV